MQPEHHKILISIIDSKRSINSSSASPSGSQDSEEKEIPGIKKKSIQRKVRRPANMIPRDYKCPFQGCGKQYW